MSRTDVTHRLIHTVPYYIKLVNNYEHMLPGFVRENTRIEGVFDENIRGLSGL